MTTEPGEISLTTLLLERPPGTSALVRDAIVLHQVAGQILRAPDDLLMHCASEHCNGERFFDLSEKHSDRIPLDIPAYLRLVYHCANCNDTSKTFILEIEGVQLNQARVSKMAEKPAYGTPVPNKLLSLVGPERENFFKGRRCENQSLGVGAFAYYRRVVEMQRERIFASIIAAAEKLCMEPADLDKLRAASKETQFSKSLDMAKEVMPPRLLIQGQSPLKLLHNALSHGVHNLDDDECLAYAHSIRVVLAQLAESLAQVHKDEAEVQNAVKKLMSVRR